MLAAFALGRLLTSVAVTPGGLGLVEAGSLALLVAMGADPAQAAGGILLFTIFTHILEIPFGVLAWLVWLWGRARASRAAKVTTPLPASVDDRAAAVHSPPGDRPGPPASRHRRRETDRRVSKPRCSAGAGRMLAGRACRYHSRPKISPNSGGGIRVKTPSVRGPESAVAWLAWARIDARRCRACPRTSMQWVTSAARRVRVRPGLADPPAGSGAAAGSRLGRGQQPVPRHGRLQHHRGAGQIARRRRRSRAPRDDPDGRSRRWRHSWSAHWPVPRPGWRATRPATWSRSASTNRGGRPAGGAGVGSLASPESA